MLNFWATWCAPCREEIPDFVELQEELGTEDVVFVGVSTEKGNDRGIAYFAEEMGISSRHRSLVLKGRPTTSAVLANSSTGRAWDRAPTSRSHMRSSRSTTPRATRFGRGTRSTTASVGATCTGGVIAPPSHSRFYLMPIAAPPATAARLRAEVDRRRTFGIISHPDAGKTTLTEQLLLLGGAIHLAGDVHARKTGRAARSDWMEIEQQRGISVTSSVMSFAYAGCEMNLLDTPGHHDFSEDTYRVLTAVDSALMVIDSVKGVEVQTQKLMEVCRLRATPILTFINKLDREGRDPLELLSDIEEHLGIDAAPVTWPVGMGERFRGTYHLTEHTLHLVAPPAGTPEIVETTGLDDPLLDALLGRQADHLRADAELLAGAGTPYDFDAYRAGTQTPVLFGSAIDGFGVPDLLGFFAEIAPPPQPRATTAREVSPYEAAFSGFVFKVQANMDPNHRDRIAFLRVCSGRFERGMKVRHQRIERDVRLANATAFLAQNRGGVEAAYPGDIIGIPNHGTIRVGDSFSEGEAFRFVGLPSFAPEHFRRVRVENALRAKQLEKGLYHLTEEGSIQLFRPLTSNDYLLGAVGPLQFDVVAQRLANEYGVDALFDSQPYELARWVEAGDAERLKAFERREANQLARDAEGRLVFLGRSAFWLQQTEKDWPELRFRSTVEME